MAKQVEKAPVVTVDNRGFVCADGVCLGKLIQDSTALQVVDRDRRRSELRGTRYVVVPLSELSKLVQKK